MSLSYYEQIGENSPQRHGEKRGSTEGDFLFCSRKKENLPLCILFFLRVSVVNILLLENGLPAKIQT